MEDEEKANFKIPFMIWGGCVIIIVLIYWGAMYALYDTKQCSPWLEPNEFGDMFGFLSCLFSGLAFAGLIVTIRQQREDLGLQRKELQRANQEAAAQTAQFEEQTKQFKEQIDISRLNQAKNEFYQRLSLLKQQESDIVYRWKERLDYSTDTKRVQVNGIEAVATYYKNRGLKHQGYDNLCTREPLEVWMRSFFTLVKDLMDFYHDEESRHFYIRILINCTSFHERALLYFDYKNLQSESVNKTMKYLLEKKFINPSDFPS